MGFFNLEKNWYLTDCTLAKGLGDIKVFWDRYGFLRLLCKMQQSISHHPDLKTAVLFALLKKYVKLTDDWLHLALHTTVYFT